MTFSVVQILYNGDNWIEASISSWTAFTTGTQWVYRSLFFFKWRICVYLWNCVLMHVNPTCECAYIHLYVYKFVYECVSVCACIWVHMCIIMFVFTQPLRKEEGYDTKSIYKLNKADLNSAFSFSNNAFYLISYSAKIWHKADLWWGPVRCRNLYTALSTKQ